MPLGCSWRKGEPTFRTPSILLCLALRNRRRQRLAPEEKPNPRRTTTSLSGGSATTKKVNMFKGGNCRSQSPVLVSSAAHSRTSLPCPFGPSIPASTKSACGQFAGFEIKIVYASKLVSQIARFCVRQHKCCRLESPSMAYLCVRQCPDCAERHH